MPDMPFEFGGGATKLSEGDTQEFFDAAEAASSHLLGDGHALVERREYLSPEGTYARLRRTTIREDGEVAGFFVVASLFTADDVQEVADGSVEDDEEDSDDEDKFRELDEVCSSFKGKYVELIFNTKTSEFCRVESFFATCILRISGEIEIDEGQSVFRIDKSHEDYDETSEIVQVFNGDAQTPQTEDVRILKGIVALLRN